MQLHVAGALSTEKRVQVNPDWFWFYSLLDEKVAQAFLNQLDGVVNAIPILLFDAQMKITLSYSCI